MRTYEITEYAEEESTLVTLMRGERKLLVHIESDEDALAILAEEMQWFESV